MGWSEARRHHILHVHAHSACLNRVSPMLEVYISSPSQFSSSDARVRSLTNTYTHLHTMIVITLYAVLSLTIVAMNSQKTRVLGNFEIQNLALNVIFEKNLYFEK